MARIDNFKGNTKGTQFGSGQDPTKGGRKKNIYTVLKENGYSKNDVNTIFEEIIYYNITDLKKLKNDKTKPAILLMVASACINAIETGEWRYVQNILEHVIGKPMQRVEQAVSMKGAYSDMSDEQVKAELKRLDGKR